MPVKTSLKNLVHEEIICVECYSNRSMFGKMEKLVGPWGGGNSCVAAARIIIIFLLRTELLYVCMTA